MLLVPRLIPSPVPPRALHRDHRTSMPTRNRCTRVWGPPSELSSLSVSVCLSFRASLPPCTPPLCSYPDLGFPHCCSHMSDFSQPPAAPAHPTKAPAFHTATTAKQHLLFGSLNSGSQCSPLIGPTQHSVEGSLCPWAPVRARPPFSTNRTWLGSSLPSLWAQHLQQGLCPGHPSLTLSPQGL